MQVLVRFQMRSYQKHCLSIRCSCLRTSCLTTMLSGSSSGERSSRPLTCSRRVRRCTRHPLVVALLSDVGIRNVSSNAPLNTTMRRGSVMGNESIVLAGRIEVVDRDTGDVERVRADMEGAYAEDSKLGIRTISSVSNVRASTTWSKDVCCNNTQRRPSAFPSRLGRRHSAREPCHAPL